MASRAIFAARGLTIGFGGVDILKNVDLEIFRGDKVLVSGPSGSGKSLLLGVASGSLSEQAVVSGAFSFADRNGWQENRTYRQFRCSRIVHDRYGLLLQDTMQSLHPYRSIRKQFPDELEDAELITRFSSVRLKYQQFADGDEWRMPHHTSGGERQRISLLLTRLGQRDFLFLDEPLTDIDLISRTVVQDAVAAVLHDPGYTVLLVSHDWDWLQHPVRHLVIDGDKLVEQSGASSGASVLDRDLIKKIKTSDRKLPQNKTSKPVASLKIKQPTAIGSAGFHLLPGAIEVGEGARIGIIGESGCGKSSIIRLFAGLGPKKLYGSTVMASLCLDGEVIDIQGMHRRRRSGHLQLVHQDTTGTAIAGEKFSDHLRRILRYKGIGDEAFIKMVKRFAAELGLLTDTTTAETSIAVDDDQNSGLIEPIFRKSYAQMSMGMRRRASLLRTFLLFDIFHPADRRAPKILFLDEISRGLDAFNRDLMASALRKFSEDFNVAMVLISHDLSFLVEVCGELLMMFNGAILPRRIALADLVGFLEPAGKNRSRNPYYHSYFNQIELNRSEGFTRRAGSDRTISAGCYLAQKFVCRNNLVGECEIHQTLTDEITVGICE